MFRNIMQDKLSVIIPFGQPDEHGFIFSKDCKFDISKCKGAVEIKHTEIGIIITQISINEIKGISK